MIKAVLFDYDGVLVNSMSFHVKAWQTVFKKLNIEIKPEEVLLTEGSRSIELARKIFKERNRKISEDTLNQFVERKQKLYSDITQAKTANGAKSFITKLINQGLILGLVTGTTRSHVEEILQPEVIAQFEVVVTGDDIQEGKPNPEAYLKAAALLQIEPAWCLVIENAPLGIQAAKLAGMKVIALSTTLERRYLNRADLIVKDLSHMSDQWNRISFL